jgi:predicted transcriptional regulator/GTPase SAR1 family protein
MNLEYKATKFKTVSDIEIPDIFYRRYKSGISVMDELFGEGILPGSSVTMCAAAGCGKTTLLLQLLEGLSKNGYNVGYSSGEENTYQLAFTCDRIGVKKVAVANMTDIDELVDAMDDLDALVVDSFQALTTTKKMNSRALEKYAVSKLTRAAKDKECTVFFIMHLTKDGKLKGGTIVPHTVDVNMNIEIDGDIDDNARKIFFTKNRFGALNELTLFIGAKGYDFSAPVKVEESENKAPSKKGRKAKDLEAILNITEPPHLTADRVMTELGVEYNRAYNLLRELVLNGKIDKFGKGKSAIYKHKNLNNGGNVNGLLNAADSMKLFLKVAS